MEDRCLRWKLEADYATPKRNKPPMADEEIEVEAVQVLKKSLKLRTVSKLSIEKCTHMLS